MLNNNIYIPFRILYFDCTITCLNITIACSTLKLDNLNFVIDGTHSKEGQKIGIVMEETVKNKTELRTVNFKVNIL